MQWNRAVVGALEWMMQPNIPWMWSIIQIKMSPLVTLSPWKWNIHLTNLVTTLWSIGYGHKYCSYDLVVVKEVVERCLAKIGTRSKRGICNIKYVNVFPFPPPLPKCEKLSIELIELFNDFIFITAIRMYPIKPINTNIFSLRRWLALSFSFFLSNFLPMFTL